MEQNEEQSKKTFTIPIQYLVVMAVVAVLVIGYATPQVLLTYKINTLTKECVQTTLAADCVTRMRDMGHELAEAGKLDDAEIWYKRSATVNDAQAMFHIGWLYYQKTLRQQKNGDTLSADFTEAKLWFHKSAQLGFVPAMNNLAVLCLLQPNTKDIGRSWLIKAANYHNPVAMGNVLQSKTSLHIKDTKAWEQWHPRRTNAVDMHPSILERTLYGTKVISSGVAKKLRVSIKENETLKLHNIMSDRAVLMFQ